MDSILIKPRDEDEMKYIQEIMASMQIETKVISKDHKDDLELATLMKDVDTKAIIREDTDEPVALTDDQRKMLEQSELEIQQKNLITEVLIQNDEDQWLNE